MAQSNIEVNPVGKPITRESAALTIRFVKARLKGKTYAAIAGPAELSLQAVRDRIVRFQFDHPTEYRALVKAQRDTEKAKRTPKPAVTETPAVELAVAA